jgi:hypothetical protein
MTEKMAELRVTYGEFQQEFSEKGDKLNESKSKVKT